MRLRIPPLRFLLEKSKFQFFISGDYFKRKLFNAWKKRQWRKYFKSQDYDFDYCSLLSMIELKLTLIGMTIYTNGLIVDRKKVMSSIWRARKYIKHLQDIDTFVYNKNEKEMIDTFGQTLNTEMKFLHTPGEKLGKIEFEDSTKTPVSEKVLEAMKQLHSTQLSNYFKDEDSYFNENLLHFYRELKKNLRTWWD